MIRETEWSAGVAAAEGDRSGSPELFADRVSNFSAVSGSTPGGPWPRWPASAPPPPTRGIRRGLATDVFLLMSGQRHLGRRLSWLSRLGIPTVMLWIGSDVVIHAPRASRAVIEDAWHWCRAPWIQRRIG